MAGVKAYDHADLKNLDFPENDVEELAALPVQTGVLLSCSQGEFSFEDKSLGSGHGVFFYHVIKGLEGAAQDNDGQVTWDGLGLYVRTKVPSTVERPQSNNVTSSDGWAFTSSVGQFQPNNFGLYDMIGNARESCQDWWGESYYRESPKSNPTGPPKGSLRVIRGGGWDNGDFSCRSANRFRSVPAHSDCAHGFRVVCER